MLSNVIMNIVPSLINRERISFMYLYLPFQVNAGLYFLVFGESLFNDGVCVVLYNSMNTLASLTRSVNGHDILMAVFSFFTVAFGGAFFGFLHGIFCSAITRSFHNMSTLTHFPA